MQFQIEACPRSPAARTFVAYYQIDAVRQEAAISVAIRRFQEQNPDKDVADYEFTVVRL